MGPRLAVALAALAAGAIALVAPAAAETQEEAVAYVFLGLGDNAALTRGQTQLNWKEISSSPAVFQGHGEGGGKRYDVKFSVSAAGDCDYEIKLSGAPNVVRGGEALYAKVAVKDITAISPDEFHVKIEGDGYCQTGSLNPNCVVVHTADVYGSIDPAKHGTMVEQIQTDACMTP